MGVDAVSELPLFPASWYLFDASRAIGRRPVVKSMLGRDIVAFRTTDGRLAAMDARCAHFGANLGNGRMVDDTIQCPYHGWRYDAEGECVAIPSGCPIPDFARQRTYAVQERHGYVFLFNGAEPLFPLPWFFDVGPDGFAASRPFEFVAETPWPSITGHAFDLQHFLFVHDRRLVETPIIDAPAPYVRRIRYRAEVVPRNWRDNVLAAIGGRTVSASLDVWGGTFAMITATFERFTSRFLMTMCPINRRETRCEGIVFGRGVGRLVLPIRRYFTHAYLAEENRSLGATISVPHRFVESDRPLQEYFAFLETLSHQGEKL